MKALLDTYYQALADNRLAPDAAQLRTVERLAAFADTLEERAQQRGVAGWRQAPMRWLLRTGRHKALAGPQGVYLHGHVGRGKTLLMDLFFEQVAVPQKRRVHFHAFMLEVHDYLHHLRRARTAGVAMDDALLRCAADIAGKVRLLCLDEFQVRDVADAMILGRLFGALFAAGVAVVMTSNVAPDDLYLDGLQRDRFLPFIDLLKTRTDVIALESAEDYRLRRIAGEPLFFWPHSPKAVAQLDHIFAAMTDGAVGAPATVAVKGRRLHVPRAAHAVAMFDFDDICGIAASAADYLALVSEYRLLIIKDVPQLDDQRRDQALRFVTLVDTLYDARRLLALSLAAPPAHIYQGDALAGVFERTVSRLAEMQSAHYRENAL